MPSTKYTITRWNGDYELEIDYEVGPYDAGYSYGPDYMREPPSGGDVTELTAYHDGEEFKLNPSETEEIETHIYATHEYW